MRLKLIGVYGVLIIALGVSVRTCIDLSLTENQEASLDSRVREAAAHARAAFDARGLRLVALANMAASNAKVAYVLDQWAKVSSEDTRVRLVKRFLEFHVERDRRDAFDRIVAGDPALRLAAPPPPAPAPAAQAGGTAEPAPAAPSAGGGATGAIRRDRVDGVAKVVAGRDEAAKAAGPSHKAEPKGDGGKVGDGAVMSAKHPPPDEPAPEGERPGGAAAPEGERPGGGAAAAPEGTPTGAGSEAPTGAGAGPVEGAAPAAAATPGAGEFKQPTTPEGEPNYGALAQAYREGSQICALVGCTDDERSPFLTLFWADFPMCEQQTCSDKEIAGLYALVNAATMLTADDFAFAKCREAYAADLENAVREMVNKQKEAVLARRAAEVAAAGGRRTGEPAAELPVEVSFEPAQLNLEKYPACQEFAAKSVAALVGEINGRLFSEIAHKAAAEALAVLRERSAFNLEFLWLIDAQTGRGIAKDREYRKDTADRHYYEKPIDKIFEGFWTPEDRDAQAKALEKAAKDLWEKLAEQGLHREPGESEISFYRRAGPKEVRRAAEALGWSGDKLAEVDLLVQELWRKEAVADLVAQIRSGMFYRDLWVTRRSIDDQTTGFVEVAMVPSRNQEGRTGGLVALAAKVDTLAPIAREAHAKLLVMRSVFKPGEDQDPTQIVGTGNDAVGEKEGLSDDFRKAVRTEFERDVLAAAGGNPTGDTAEAVPRDFDFGGSDYLALTVALPNDASEVVRQDRSFAIGDMAVTVLVDKSRAKEAMATVSWVWVFTGGAVLIAIIAALLLGHFFLKPIAQIEEGLLRIMNGDWTHRFDVRSAEVGGLSYRINQLMAALLGDEEEGEMDMGEEAAPADPKDAQYRDLYAKFQAAQRQVGQDPGSVTYDDFRNRLVDNEQKILQKNPGRQVDFEIVVAGNQITFKPIIR